MRAVVPQRGGDTVQVEVYRNESRIGWIVYRHLAESGDIEYPPEQSYICVGDILGVVSDDTTTGGGCYDLTHVHLDWKAEHDDDPATETVPMQSTVDVCCKATPEVITSRDVLGTLTPLDFLELDSQLPDKTPRLPKC